MSKTVREHSDAASVETRQVGVVCFDSDNPILDATVYGLCETCGGSKECADCGGSGNELGGVHTQEAQYVEVTERCETCNGTGACPDCTTVSVVTKELRERAIAAVVEKTCYFGPLDELAPMHRDGLAALVDAVLSTVLRDVRVAKEIVKVEPDTALVDGDTIAILED